MREWYNKAISGKMSSIEKKEANEMMQLMKNEQKKDLKLMRNSEDFAYFYEYDILNEKFIKRLQDVLK
jgi:hypothetical protein